MSPHTPKLLNNGAKPAIIQVRVVNPMGDSNKPWNANGFIVSKDIVSLEKLPVFFIMVHRLLSYYSVISFLLVLCCHTDFSKNMSHNSTFSDASFE